MKPSRSEFVAMPFNPRAKYRQIYRDLHGAITAGKYGVGERIPTETELASNYGTSRPTVAKALRDLEQAGYLSRRRGLGTFVTYRQRTHAKLVGLIIPRPGEGIFAPMSAGILQEAESSGFGVLMAGSLMSGQEVAVAQEEAFCEQLLSRQVAGVLFGPLDVLPAQARLNLQIAERLQQAGVSVVLLDRDVCDYPERSRFDLVGINNRRESRIITEHLLRLGCRRIEYIRDHVIVSTATARVEGYRDAMAAYGIEVEPDWIHPWDPADSSFVRDLIRSSLAEAYVCANDRLATEFMHWLAVHGVRVPDDVRVVGFDDIERSARLPVGLTTMRQPAAALGRAAVRTLLERLERPDMPARELMLACELVVRESCGARLNARAEAAG